MVPKIFWGPEWSRGGSNNLSKNNALILMGDWCESLNATSTNKTEITGADKSKKHVALLCVNIKKKLAIFFRERCFFS
jgi:hypothetical protein